MMGKREICFDKSIPYHIVSRAVEGRQIFREEDDLFRFIFYTYASNIGRPAPNIRRQDIKKAALSLLNGEEISKNLIVDEQPPLVYRLSFVFVVNHHHEILVPNIEGGISKYLQKRHTSFAKYYNLKHKRRANLFERPSKIIPIQTNFQLDAVLRYVNVKNVLDVYQPGWKENGFKDEKEAFKFLNDYQFSSFPDLFGKRNSKILAPKEVLEKYLGKEITINKEDFLNFIKDYLKGALVSYYPFFLE